MSKITELEAAVAAPFTEFELTSERDRTFRVLPAALHGRPCRSPEEGGRKYEKPWHRAAVHMAAKLFKPREIAELLHVSVDSVNSLMSTDWVQTEVTLAMDAMGGDIMDMIKEEVVPSIRKLVELRDDEKTPKAVAANIATTFIDRIIGKATQRVEISKTPTSGDPVQEAARLRQEVALLQKDLGFTPSAS